MATFRVHASVNGLFNVRLCAFTAKDFYFLELVGIPVFH